LSDSQWTSDILLADRQTSLASIQSRKH